jgi:molybdopterin-containing oxidoreductase family membrane subunit
MPLIPDVALLRDQGDRFPKWQHNLYKRLALGWKGLPEQKRLLHRAIRIMAILIIPIAFGIHTVTSWLFASTMRPGWNSTDFGPYFVSGAFMVGAAAVIAVMYVLRRHYKLEKYFTLEHFDLMGKVLVMLSLLYAYFNLNEYFMPAYKMEGGEAEHLKDLLYGEYALLFWSVQILGMLVPTILLLFKKFRNPKPIFFISLLVIAGAWFKRFLIVVPTLTHPLIPTHRVPESWLHYFPTWEEWSITIGSLAGALLLVTFLIRIFPIVPIVETIEEQEEEVQEAKAVLETIENKR